MTEILARLTAPSAYRYASCEILEDYGRQLRELIAYIKQPRTTADIATAAEFLLDVCEEYYVICARGYGFPSSLAYTLMTMSRISTHLCTQRAICSFYMRRSKITAPSTANIHQMFFNPGNGYGQRLSSVSAYLIPCKFVMLVTSGGS